MNLKAALNASVAAIAIAALAGTAHGQNVSSRPDASTVPSAPGAGAVVPPQPASPPPTGSQSAGNTVQEVIVTANKREENLNRVGLTVSAFTATTLKERQVVTLNDVASLVPGLSFSTSGNNTPILTLRGVGFNDSSVGSYPAVSVYQDQAPLPFPVMASHSDYDLERVEVLKGPQGTLFGENSTGGAINFIAAKPTATDQAGGDVTYGRFNDFVGNAYVSGPITDTLRARLALTGETADGWQYSYTRPGDTLGQQSVFAGRLLLAWNPFKRLRVNLDLNGWYDGSDPEAPQLIAVRPQNPTPSPNELVYPFAPQNARAADWDTYPNRPHGNRRQYQTALRIDYDLTNSLTLTSITNYVNYLQNMGFENDGTSLYELDIISDRAFARSFNEELRISNSAQSKLRYTVGGYYENSNTQENQLAHYIDNSNAFAFGFTGNDTLNQQQIRNYAFFGSAEYDVLQRLTIKGGLRYTDSRNAALTCGYADSSGTANTFFNYLGSVLGTVPFTPLTNANPPLQRCFSLNANDVPSETPYHAVLSQSNVSWRAGVDFKATPTTLFYVDFAKGYKAGSFPILAAATETQFAPVSQESVMDYEGGVKTLLFDRRLQLNAAGFYYDYTDKQILGKLLDPVFGILDALINVPKSRVIGGEADATFRPIEPLTFTASMTYLSTEIENYTGLNSIGVQQNADGDPLPFAPKFSYNIDGEYRAHQLIPGGATFVGFDVTGQTSTDTTIGGSQITIPASPYNRVLPGLTHPFTTNAYALLDLRAGYEPSSGAWRVMVWGKNVFNKYYWNNVVTDGDFNVRYAARPVTYGITVGVKFR